MRKTTKRGLVTIVFILSTTQVVYFYFFGGYSSRLQTLTRDLDRNRAYVSSNETSSAHRLLRQDNQFQKPSNLVAKIDKSSGKPKSTASSNSEAVFPPLLRNTEMYFHSPYQPLLYGKQRRKQGFLTIGIPSVSRPNTDKVYVYETLDSLIKNTKDDEKSDITIVIYICDMNDTYNSKISQAIYNKYKDFCDTGFIHIIQGTPDIYPDLSKVKQTFNDPMPRIKWRAKQNIDFAYLSFYSRNLSQYYIQLEDDVITASDYIDDIRKFISAQTKPWFLLEFTYLGFIGKMFHSADLDRVAYYLLSFYDRMPGDLLLGQIRKIMGQEKPIHSKKSLFQHIGKFSSLKDKLMPSLDRDFKDAGSVHLSINDIPRGDNPTAKILTSLTQYENYEPIFAYDNSDKYFWARDVKKNQHFTILFQRPQQISRIIITTGNPNTKVDSIQYASLQLAVRDTVGESPKDLKGCGEFKKFVDLVGGEVDTKALGLESKIPPNVICLQIKIERNQKIWVMIRNVNIILK